MVDLRRGVKARANRAEAFETATAITHQLGSCPSFLYRTDIT